jgi:hypothetical protein
MVEFGGISMARDDDDLDGAISAAAADSTVSVDAITAKVSAWTLIAEGHGACSQHLHMNAQRHNSLSMTANIKLGHPIGRRQQNSPSDC